MDDNWFWCHDLLDDDFIYLKNLKRLQARDSEVAPKVRVRILTSGSRNTRFQLAVFSLFSRGYAVNRYTH